MDGTIGGIKSSSDLQGMVNNNTEAQVKNPPVEETKQRVLNQSVLDVLEKLSLPKTEIYEKLAKALLEYGHSLDKGTIDALNRLLKQLGGSQEDNVNLLAFLKSKDIPLNKELVQTIKNYLQDNNLTNLLKQYLGEESSSQVPQTFNKSTVTSKIPETVLQTAQTTSKILETIWNSMPQVAAKLLEQLPDLKPKLEKILQDKMSFPENKEFLGELKEKLSPLLKDNTLPQEIKNNLENLLKKVEGSLNELEKAETKTLPQAMKSNVLNLLKKAENDLKEFSQANSKALPQQVKDNVEGLLRKVDNAFRELNSGENKNLLSKQSFPEIREEVVSLLKDKNTPQELKQKLVQILDQIESTMPEEDLAAKSTVGEKIITDLPKEETKQWAKDSTKDTNIANEKEELPTILKKLVLDTQEGNVEKMTESLKRVVEHKKEFAQEMSNLFKDGAPKETLARMLPDVKANLEMENLLKFMQIPVAHLDNLYQARMKIDEGNKDNDKSEQRSNRILIYLDTQNLGQVKIDLTEQEKGIALRFQVEGEKVKTDLENDLPNLVDRLTSLDYNVQDISCGVSKEKPEETFLEMEKTLVFSTLRKIDLLT